MKKNILIVCMLLIGVYQLNAQRAIYFGAKAGLNIRTFGGGTTFDYFAKPGFHLGGLAEIIPRRRSNVMLQPEAYISLQGSGGFFQDNLNFWYFNVPIIIKYEVWDDLYLEIGPQVGLLFSNNVNEESFGSNQDFESTNAIDYALGLGMGYRLNEEFYFQIRYNYGFADAIEGVPSKNRNLQFSAVYFL